MKQIIKLNKGLIFLLLPCLSFLFIITLSCKGKDIKDIKDINIDDIKVGPKEAIEIANYLIQNDFPLVGDPVDVTDVDYFKTNKKNGVVSDVRTMTKDADIDITVYENSSFCKAAIKRLNTVDPEILKYINIIEYKNILMTFIVSEFKYIDPTKELSLQAYKHIQKKYE